MDALFEWPHVVTVDETDELGHANNEAFLRWMNAAAAAHSTSLGWSTKAYVQQRQGWVVRRHEIDYLGPAHPGDELIVRTWVRSFEKARSRRAYAIFAQSGSRCIARAFTVWAWINYATGRPSRIPAEIISAFPVLNQDP